MTRSIPGLPAGAWTLRSTAANVRYGLEDQLSSATAPVAAGFTLTSDPWTAGIAAFSNPNTLADATQNFTLTVNSAPAITTEPSNQTVTAGQTATFMVAVTGSAPLTYQWQSNGVNISGANSSTYTTPVTTGADDGTQFTVVVSNSLGSASAPWLLSR